PLAERLRLPFPSLLVILGFAGSEILVAAGVDTGLRADSFHDLIFFIFLPVLIFEAAFHIDARQLLRNLAPILVLAVPGLLLSTLITAALVYYGIAHASGFPWIAALLTGALLSATDPVAVVELFKRLGVPDRLALMVDGESLFNDATAIVLFSLLLHLALSPAAGYNLADAGLRMILVFCGGALVGLVNALVFQLLSRTVREPVLMGLITLLSAYAAFLMAEAVLHVSGVMAVLVTGLVMGRGIRAGGADTGGALFVHQLWSMNAFIANALVFLLMGATVTLAMFQERWLAMLIGVGGVLVARAITVFGLTPLAGLLPTVEPIPRSHRPAIYWGGLRGAVTLALALSLPVELDYWWTIQSIAFGVVLFTLFVQAPTMPWMLRRTGLAEETR
ncbi:MAG: sodium:proton antiporter, partial [Chromatiales bacterium]